ncbi:D-alanine--D-alanine ligase [Beggiatoa leptomitoformis]|uniref:D-alanine--D-alanine ligase n=1 Tax=Beggiatoa leptomitoformis TaxID=288004 RepID=A0A2N9YCS9_9GAMM|nr:D-alanine--D-alanine ligase [Beggiatoa leptomitoformis]ALG66475.1 D-alanine--D-alanine ligase [Beggiatoa leptomitoformis]AUI68234.1 D-alanine--D-alanine ligase [Beggiatoa leptomitoformis]
MTVNTTHWGKVAVLMGGTSAERDVSLKSGRAVLTALLNQEVDAIGIDTGVGSLLEKLTENSYDHVFIALHGRGGEDGTVQGLLEQLGLPYTGSGVLGSALAMDKYRTKLVWEGLGLPTPPCVLLTEKTDFNNVVTKLGLPLMVKPASEGSSVGMSKVNDVVEIQQAYELAKQFDQVVIAEKYISGVEYTASIVQNQSLPIIRLETPRVFYDYEAKYSDNTQTRYICPSGLAPDQETTLQQLALQAFLAVGATGWGRVDLMCDATGQAWLLEVNTVPGMTDHSLVPMAAKAAGIDFDNLVLQILAST